MRTVKAYWSDWVADYEREIQSADEAMLLLQEIRQATHVPTMVEFGEPDTGRSCAIGVGREFTVVTYQHALDPPYFISRGIDDAVGHMWFCYGKERTEYLARNVISLSDGWRTIQGFFSAVGRPDTIQWEAL